MLKLVVGTQATNAHKGSLNLLMKGIQEVGSCVVGALSDLGVFKVHAMT